MRARADEMFTDQEPKEAARRRRILLDDANFWGAYVGSPISRQSLKFYYLEECIEGENPFVAETYQKILEQVARPALEKGRVLLEHRVTSIADRTSADAKEGRPTITTANGQTEDFDEVVVTAPLGWLKRNKNVFQNGLEPRLAQAIDNVSYGSLDKVYLTFENAFWNKSSPDSDQPNGTSHTHTDDTARNGVDKKQTTPNVHATTTPLHQAPTSESPPSSYPGVTHWLPPQYAPDTNPSGWNIQAMNLANLSLGQAHPTLLFYIYGACSEHIGKLVTSTPAPELEEKLISFLHPYFSRLPNYDSSDPACRPKSALGTAWAADELAGYGSYANFQVGLEAADKDIEAMREGMPDRGIWFAGEHTSPFVALGTTTGAYWSGERVAERIMERYES